MVLERTYQIQDPPERPMSGDDYENLITTEWENLLNREPSPSEPEIQAFFEKYPWEEGVGRRGSKKGVKKGVKMIR